MFSIVKLHSRLAVEMQALYGSAAAGKGQEGQGNWAIFEQGIMDALLSKRGDPNSIKMLLYIALRG